MQRPLANARSRAYRGGLQGVEDVHSSVSSGLLAASESFPYGRPSTDLQVAARSKVLNIMYRYCCSAGGIAAKSLLSLPDSVVLPRSSHSPGLAVRQQLAHVIARPQLDNHPACQGSLAINTIASHK